MLLVPDVLSILFWLHFYSKFHCYAIFCIFPNMSSLHKCFRLKHLWGRKAACGNCFQITPLAGPISWPLEVNSKSVGGREVKDLKLPCRCGSGLPTNNTEDTADARRVFVDLLSPAVVWPEVDGSPSSSSSCLAYRGCSSWQCTRLPVVVLSTQASTAHAGWNLVTVHEWSFPRDPEGKNCDQRWNFASKYLQAQPHVTSLSGWPPRISDVTHRWQDGSRLGSGCRLSFRPKNTLTK